MRIPVYIIYCKCCEEERMYDMELDSDVGSGGITGFGHIRLNCHRCNDYSIYIGGDHYIPSERYRYDSQRTKENLKKPIKFAFGWRYTPSEIYNNRGERV